MNLSCKIDSGWYSNVKHSLEHDLEWLRSKSTSISPFLRNLSLKNLKSTVNGRISTVIVGLSCEIDRAWFSDVKNCVEHDLEWLRSKIMYLWSFYWDFNHYGSISDTLRHDTKMYVRGRNSVKSRSRFPIGCTTIIFRVHIDSMYDIMSSTTWCVGNEQQFVELTTVRHDIYPQSSD